MKKSNNNKAGITEAIFPRENSKFPNDDSDNNNYETADQAGYIKNNSQAAHLLDTIPRMVERVEENPSPNRFNHELPQKMLEKETNLVTNMNSQNKRDINMKEEQMKTPSNNQEQNVNNIQQQIELSLKLLMLSAEISQQLFINNIEYSKDILAKSLKMTNSMSSNKQTSGFSPLLPEIMIDAMKSYSELCQNAATIFANAMNEIGSTVNEHQKILGPTSLNFFNVWNKLNPQLIAQFKSLQNAIPHVANGLAEVKEEVLSGK